MVKPIWDWRKQLPAARQVNTDLMAGALFHTQDVTYINRAFEALEELITASGTDAVIKRTIEAMRRLDHRWCRLYVVNPVNESELMSLSCFGPKPDVEQWEDKFNRGGYVIPRYDDDYRWEGWECLKKKSPLVLFCDPERDDRELVKNKYGLVAMNCRNQRCPPELQKKDGEYWIDFPLFTSDRLFGKLTLEWQPKGRPEDVRTLAIFCELTSLLLSGAVRRENQEQEKALIYRNTYERALHDVLHGIKGCPADLQHTLHSQQRAIDRLRRKLDDGGLLPDYTADLEDLVECVDDSKKSCAEMLDLIKKEKDHLQVFPNITPVDLAGLIRDMLRIESDQFRVELGTVPENLMMDLDSNGFRRLLRGMFDNAGRFSRDGRAVRVTVCVEPFEREGKPWVRVTIEDNGQGIPKEIKSRIFEKDFSTPRNDGSEGWGWGLFNARELIVELGGHIHEDGEEGKGAKFVIELPRYQEA